MRGLLAVEQRLAGRGNSLNEIVVADARALERDAVVPISWWAPGQQYVVFALRSAGLAPAEALKLLVVSTWLAGLVGWSAFCWLVLGDTRVVAGVVTVLALHRASHAGAFEYSGGETLLWGVFPLVVLVNLRAFGARGPAAPGWALAAGTLSALLVALKYSGGLLGLGIGLVWLGSVVARDVRPATFAAYCGGALLGIAGVASLGMFELLQHGTPATPWREHPIGVVIAWSLFGPLAAMTDGIDIATRAFRRLGFGDPSGMAIGAIVVSLGAFVIAGAVLVRRASLAWSPGGRLGSIGLRLAAGITVTVSVGLAVLMLGGGIISWEARHHQYGAFLLMPFAAGALGAAMRQRSAAVRGWAVACLLVFFAVPSVYGGTILAARLVRAAADRDDDRQAASQGWPASAEALETVGEELSSLPDGTLVATPAIRAGLALSARRLLIVMESGSWDADRFHGRPAGGIALLLPPGLEDDDAGRLQRSFVDVGAWHRHPLVNSPGATLWIGR